MVSNCSTCLENCQYHQQELLIAHKVPTVPWHKMGMDFFSFRGRDYLLVVDYLSNYTEVCLLNDTQQFSHCEIKINLLILCHQ